MGQSGRRRRQPGQPKTWDNRDNRATVTIVTTGTTVTTGTAVTTVKTVTKGKEVTTGKTE